MSFSNVIKRASTAVTLALGLWSGPAVAQDTAWQMNCIDDRVCELKSEILRDDTVAARMSIFNVRGYFFLQYTIPLGVDLDSGIMISVDDGPQQPTVLTNCSGFGCTGTMDLVTDDIQAMIAGEALRVFFTSDTNLDVFAIGFDLTGFAAGYSELTSQ